MKLFNTKGMMLFPNPLKKSDVCESENLLVIKECYCPNGHNLISDKAIFNGFKGIIMKISRKIQSGLVALSPVYGHKSRVSLSLSIKPSEIWQASCPMCDAKFPNFSKCLCKADIFTIFLDENADFSNSILICNRIDCFNAQVKFKDKILHYSGIET